MNQTDSDKVQLAAAIRKLGRAFNPEVLQATYDLHAPLQARAPKDGVEIVRDIAYGEHVRHRLDLYVPAHKPSKAPVVVYVHGGGYIAGERSALPGLIYDNVPTFFARNGMIGVNMTYRLAPEHKWPAGGADIGRAVAWLRHHVAAQGGDPDCIVLMGQSAGATHVATWTLIPEVHGTAGPRTAGAILLSGVFAPHDPQFSPGKPPPHQLAYFGEDETKWAERSPINHVRPGHPPIFVSVTEFDPYPLQWGSPALVAALTRCDGQMPWFVYARDQNHVSPAMQINLPFDTLGPELLDFVRRISGSR
jgi:acetyl esterase/lipase